MTEMRQISNDEYHAGKGLSASGLKLFMISPSHYWAAYLDPEREPRKTTNAMMIGTAIHTATLEPEDFPHSYAVVPDGIDRRSTDGKALFAEIEASGKTPLKQDECKTIQLAAASARAHPAIARILSHKKGLVESSIYWSDQETGLLCKMRPDFHIPPCEEHPHGLIFDLKSAEDASVSGFQRAAYICGYHIQSPWYSDGFQAFYGTNEPPQFLFGAVEKGAPFAVAVYAASDIFMDYGRQRIAEALDAFVECQRLNKWPGYPEEILPLELPAWVKVSNDEKVEVSYV